MSRVVKKAKLKIFTSQVLSVFAYVVLFSQVEVVIAGNVEAPPNGTSQSNARAVAQRLSDEAMRLYKQGTAESLRSSIGKWQEALKLYQEINDKNSQAIILNSIGVVSSKLGDNQQALSFFNQALPLAIEIGDKTGQASILNNIGFFYDALGDSQQALKSYNQSLSLITEVGNQAEQANTLNNIGAVYYAIGDMQQALKYYNQALSLTIEVKDKKGQANTLSLCRLQRLQRLQIKPLTLLSFSTTYRVVT